VSIITTPTRHAYPDYRPDRRILHNPLSWYEGNPRLRWQRGRVLWSTR